MEIFNKFLVFPLDYKTKIGFLSLDNVKNSFTVDVDWNFSINSQKPNMFLESANDDEKLEKQTAEKDDLEIHNIAVAKNSKLLAYSASDKTLFLCKMEGSTCKTLSRRCFLRTAGCIRFSESNKCILYLADKTGDVFEYLCDENNYDKPGRWIFGHISQILDLQVSLSSKYIITSDRDEKIRITNSPAYHEIESYCLGHKEFVSSLIALPNDLLLSLSGDGSMRLWNLNGKQISSINFEFTPILFKHLQNISSQGALCISTSDFTVKIYKYEIIDGSALKIHLMSDKKYNNDVEVAAGNEKFYIEFIDELGKASIDEVQIDDKTANFTTIYRDVLSLLNVDNLQFKIFKPFDVSILFKNGGKYDNVKDYIDRKKARIENQAKKNVNKDK